MWTAAGLGHGCCSHAGLEQYASCHQSDTAAVAAPVVAIAFFMNHVLLIFEKCRVNQ
jgi:hypothetical protein